nr:hypothetical protein [Tanacetum cinerariifolium]
MVVINDHDMIDTCEASIPRDVIEIGEGLIPRDVFDVGEGSIPRDMQGLNNESLEGQEEQIGEASIPRDVIETDKGLIPRDVFDGLMSRDVIDIGEGSIPRDMQGLNNESLEGQEEQIGEGSIPRDMQGLNNESLEGQEEQIDEANIELYKDDDDFDPTPKAPRTGLTTFEDDKPKRGYIFDSFKAGYEMYKVYYKKGRFNIKKSGIKRYKGKITHMYVLCNIGGKSRSKVEINTLKEGEEDGEKD